MSSESGQWERVASELRACRQAQRQAWGDVDNATLGRYLADDVTPDERRRIEKELEQRPELRKLTDLVGDVLRDCEPVAAPQSADRPAVLPFRATVPVPKSMTRRWRQWAAVAAAACVLLALGYTVLPKGVGPSPAGWRGGLAEAPGSGLTMTTAVAYHPNLDSGNPDLTNSVLGQDDERPGSPPTSPVLDRVVVVCADGLCSAGETYQQHGDLDLAEFSYKLAYSIRESKLGPNAPPTVEVRRKVGEVYQAAFALADPAADKTGPMAVYSPTASPDHATYFEKTKEAQLRTSAAQLRDRLNRQPGEVRRSVVPILVENLREANEAKTPEACEQLGRALAELGPAAKDALPVLDACLKQQDLNLTPKGRAAVLEAKVRLENAATPDPEAGPPEAADPGPATGPPP